MSRWMRNGTFLLFLAVLLGALGASAQPAGELRLLQRIPLPIGNSIPTDIRWASNDSVYVSLFMDGVAEVGLDGAVRRTLAPGARTLELKNYTSLAVSPGRLAVSSAVHSLVWRTVRPKAGGSFVFHRQRFRDVYDFDIFGDRILVLGLDKAEPGGPYAPKGEIAWVGRLSEGEEFADLKPVLHAPAGPGAPQMYNCGLHRMSAVRFLPDGSFVTAPGFQDGVHLFNAAGKRVRSWTNEQIGIDTHVRCGEMTAADEEKLRGDDAEFARFVKSHRLIDDVLPLPEGPGLLVRAWGKDNKVHWTVKVLRPDGIRTYTVPVVGNRLHDRLQGDVRSGRIVLLLSRSGHPLAKTPVDLSAEILLMQVPNI